MGRQGSARLDRLCTGVSDDLRQGRYPAASSCLANGQWTVARSQPTNSTGS